jgi:hypothetical protein
VTEKKNEYVSPDRWRISLPEGWGPMGVLSGEPLNTNRPIVFCDNKSTNRLDPPSITWMRADRPITSEAWLQYSTTTMLSGPVGAKEAQAATLAAFPIAGKVIEANVVRLPDGNKALELIEEITDTESGAVSSHGYQLIFSVRNDEPGPVLMQRLVFYSSPVEYKKLLPEVRIAARSFEYF